MKAIQYILRAGVACFCAAVALTSCNKDPEYYEPVSYPDEMHVACSVTDITLNKAQAKENAITLTWSSIHSPLSADDSISYMVCFYSASDKEQKSDYIETTETTLTLTHDELNSIVARWVLPGNEIKVTAQVLGVVHNEYTYVKPEISTVDFTVVGYEKYPPYLYLHIVEDGQTKPELKMEQRQLGTGIYEVNVPNLTICDYYFTTASQAAYPSYEKAEDGSLKYVESGDNDNPTYSMFSNEEIGSRTFIVDVNSEYNDCRVLDFVQLPTPGQIWIVGDGTSIGWNPNNANGKMEMVGSAREPYIYAWTGEFIAGKEFKIGLGTDYSGLFFFAPEANLDPLTDHRLAEPRLQDQGGDMKWVPSVSGKYTLKLYLLRDDLHTSFEPAE